MKIITVSGKAGSGKDTLANLLKESLSSHRHNTLIVHQADLLKYMAKMFFGWNGEKDEQGRTLLQWLGTDLIRNLSPNYWVDHIKDALYFIEYAQANYDNKNYKHYDYVIIPDTRFPNEIERFKESGYEVFSVRVNRPDKLKLTEEQTQHVSETALDNYDFDFVVENKSMDCLRGYSVLISNILCCDCETPTYVSPVDEFYKKLCSEQKCR